MTAERFAEIAGRLDMESDDFYDRIGSVRGEDVQELLDEVATLRLALAAMEQRTGARRLVVDIVEAGRVSERLDDGWWNVGAVTLNGKPEDLADLPIGPAVLEVRS